MEVACDTANRPALPDEMPVMVLPDCHLFPGCLMPLFIFEERYKRMLEHILSEHRMFCIGNRDGDHENAPISSCSTAGLVRACVKLEDGTSQLLLQGVSRIRLKHWKQTVPFRIAGIEKVQTIVGDAAFIASRKTRALELFARSSKAESGKKLCDFLEKHHCAELVCDVISYHFTRCPKLQQKLLAEASLEVRYDMLIEAMEKHGCS